MVAAFYSLAYVSFLYVATLREANATALLSLGVTPNTMSTFTDLRPVLYLLRQVVMNPC